MNGSDVSRALALLGGGSPASNLESQGIEFKTVSDSVKSTLTMLADASVCFINAEGGATVLGIDDKATERSEALVGVPAAYTPDLVRKGIFDRTRPPITPLVSEEMVDGVRLLVITVPQGVLPHSNSAGLATKRLGSECLPFSPEQQREVMIARGYVDWSADSSGLDPRRLDQVELGRLRAFLTAAGREHLAALDTMALLSALRLLAADGSVTNAGVLLLADERTLRTVVPDYGYSYQFRPTPGSEAIARSRGARPLLAAVEAVMDAVDPRREVHPLNIAGGVQLQLTDYPADAVRELVVNAFIHRSYETHGTVDVEHSPERLAIASPGGLVAGVTPANILTHPSTPRNRLLTEVVSILQLAERTGQGVDRAYRAMLQVGKEPPSFEDSGTLVRAVLGGGIGNDSFVRFINDLAPTAGRDVDVLLALSALRRSTSIDALRLAAAIQRPVAEAQEVLARMAEQHDLLEASRRTVTKPLPTYRLRSHVVAALSRAVAYRRRQPDEMDQKVIEHVREYGSVSNRTLQRMFDIHVYAARDMLADLRKRGLIAKIGDAQGGKAVRYGPGPNFPTAAADGSVREHRDREDQ